MGGLVGLMLAKAHPGDVGKPMIVDSLPFFGMLFGPTATVAVVEPQAKAMRDQMAASYGKPDPAGAERIARRSRSSPKPGARSRLDGKADMRVSARGDVRGHDDRPARRTGRDRDADHLALPSSAGLPATMADPFYRGEYAAAPHVTYRAGGRSAHFIMLDQPEAFAKAVAAFVGKLTHPLPLRQPRTRSRVQSTSETPAGT